MPRRNANTRDIVAEALQTFAGQGATKPELLDLIGQDLEGNIAMSLGKTLKYMADDDLVVEWRGRWYLKENAPAILNGTPKVMIPANGTHKATVAPYAGKRSTKTVTVYTSPVVYENIIGLKLVAYDGDTLKIPVFGHIRICIGMEIPMFSPDQEFYNNVETVELQIQGGQVHKLTVNRKEIVTIAPDES